MSDPTKCPICFNTISGASGATYSDDPLKTPQHFLPELRGNTLLRARQITEVQKVINDAEGESGYSGLTKWSPCDADSSVGRIKNINECREAIEALIGYTGSGTELRDFLSQDENGTPQEPYINDWLDGHRLVAGQLARGMHIEEIRKVIVPFGIPSIFALSHKTDHDNIEDLGILISYYTGISVVGNYTETPAGVPVEKYCSYPLSGYNIPYRLMLDQGGPLYYGSMWYPPEEPYYWCAGGGGNIYWMFYYTNWDSTTTTYDTTYYSEWTTYTDWKFDLICYPQTNFNLPNIKVQELLLEPVLVLLEVNKNDIWSCPFLEDSFPSSTKIITIPKVYSQYYAIFGYLPTIVDSASEEKIVIEKDILAPQGPAGVQIVADNPDLFIGTFDDGSHFLKKYNVYAPESMKQTNLSKYKLNIITSVSTQESSQYLSLDSPFGSYGLLIAKSDGVVCVGSDRTADFKYLLSYTISLDSGFILKSIILSIDGVSWKYVSDFSGSGPNDLVYSVIGGSIVFGDDVHGKKPVLGTLYAIEYIKNEISVVRWWASGQVLLSSSVPVGTYYAMINYYSVGVLQTADRSSVTYYHGGGSKGHDIISGWQNPTPGTISGVSGYSGISGTSYVPTPYG